MYTAYVRKLELQTFVYVQIGIILNYIKVSTLYMNSTLFLLIFDSNVDFCKLNFAQNY